MKFKVDIFTKGKVQDKNKDFFGHNESTFVLADGSTDKSGNTYSGKTGGEIASRVIVETCLSCKLTGSKLVSVLNESLKNVYKNLGIYDRAQKDPVYRFSSTLVFAGISDKRLNVTVVGDSGFRLNGRNSYCFPKTIDLLTSNARADYITKTGDIENSREFILPLLKKQLEYQNNANHVLGYGSIDGIFTPKQFIKEYSFDMGKIKTVEIFSDGYSSVPLQVSIKDWERKYKEVEKEDPYKYLKYKSTKNKDDRTVAIIKFSN